MQDGARLKKQEDFYPNEVFICHGVGLLVGSLDDMIDHLKKKATEKLVMKLRTRWIVVKALLELSVAGFDIEEVESAGICTC